MAFKILSLKVQKDTSSKAISIGRGNGIGICIDAPRSFIMKLSAILTLLLSYSGLLVLVAGWSKEGKRKVFIANTPDGPIWQV